MSNEASLVIGLLMMATGAVLLYVAAVIYPDMQGRINGMINHEGIGAQNERARLLKTQAVHDSLMYWMYLMLAGGLIIAVMSGRH